MQKHVLAFKITYETAGTYIVGTYFPGGTQQMFIREFPPRGLTPYPFIFQFLTKKVTPLTYLVYNSASLLTAVNALSFKQESITKIERFLDFIKS